MIRYKVIHIYDLSRIRGDYSILVYFLLDQFPSQFILSQTNLLQAADSFDSSCSKVGHFAVSVHESFKRLESSKPNDLTQGPF